MADQPDDVDDELDDVDDETAAEDEQDIGDLQTLFEQVYDDE